MRAYACDGTTVNDVAALWPPAHEDTQVPGHRKVQLAASIGTSEALAYSGPGRNILPLAFRPDAPARGLQLADEENVVAIRERRRVKKVSSFDGNHEHLVTFN